MKKIFGLLILFFLLFLPALSEERSPHPAWGAEGKLINDTPGNTLQQNPQMVRLDSGDHIVVFEDARNGSTDIYAQRVDGDGKLLWGKLGQPVCTAPRDQLSPRILLDQAGGAIVAWQDDRNGNFDIYAQRLDAAGNPLWSADGVALCSAPGGQLYPEIVTDGSGGAIVLWQDYRSGAEDLYAQRLDREGQILWAADGVPVCNELSTKWQAQMINDGVGGMIVVWMDRRAGNADLYAQRLDGYGRRLWKTEGVPVAASQADQDNPALVSDGYQGALLTWKEAEGIYLQRIGSDGKTIFAAPGILAAKDAANASHPKIAGDGAGGALLAWSDPRAGDADIYLQFVNAAGQIQWGENGRILIALRGPQENPKISGSGPWAVVWEDGRDQTTQGKQLYAQRIGRDGYYYWTVTGVLVSDKGTSPQGADLTIDRQGEVMVCYQDRKKGNFDIYAQKVLADSKLAWGKFGIVVSNAVGSVVQQEVRVAGDSKGGYLFAFEDYRNGFSNIYLQRVNERGELLWNRAAVAAASGPYNQRDPQIVADGSGGAIVMFEDSRDPIGSKIYAQRINFAGQLVWEAGGILLTPGSRNSEQSQPQVVPDGAGGAVCVFLDLRNPLNYVDIYGQRVNGSGKLLWGKGGSKVTAGNGNQDEVKLAENLVVVWTDYRNGDKNSDIFAQKLDLNGKTLWVEDGVPVCEAPDSQKSPALKSNGGEGAIIVWTDRGGGSYDIYAQRLDNSGRPLWLKDGIPIEQSARTQQNPRLALSTNDRAVMVWEDFRFGNWDIFAQQIEGNGKLSWGEGGIMVSEAENTQYAPALLQLSQYTIVAWEDYRNGQNYSIYLQILGPWGEKVGEGQLVWASRLGARQPQLASVKSNEFLVSWEDRRGGGCSIYAQKFIF